MLKKPKKSTINTRNKELAIAFKKSPYLQVNFIVAGIIILMIIYSGIFSYAGIQHPIKSIYSFKIASTGLSRAFSEIVRGHFTKASQFNPFSIKLFSFFFIQLILRIFVSFMLFSKRFSKMQVLITDVLISVLLFLWAFYSYVAAQFN